MTSFGSPMLCTCPGGSITMILSANFAARFRSWLTMTTITPVCLTNSRRNAVTYIWCLTSRFAVGSSRRIMSASCTNPLARDTF